MSHEEPVPKPVPVEGWFTVGAVDGAHATSASAISARQKRTEGKGKRTNSGDSGAHRRSHGRRDRVVDKRREPTSFV